MRVFLPLLLASFVFFAAGSAVAQPYFAPGSYQGWDLNTAPQMVDDGTNGDLVAGDGIYSVTVNIATAGAYEWKTALSGWSDSWPHTGNSWFITLADNEDVLLTFDTNAHGDGWAPDSYWPDSDHTVGDTYKVVGDLQDEMGDPGDWDPANGTLLMHDDGVGGDATAGDGVYTYCGQISTAGDYQWKVAVNGDWAQQFGTDGPSVNAGTWMITVANDNDEWCFYLDVNTGRIYAEESGPVPTQSETWGGIKRLYR